eukprot:s5042_g3.t1
MAGLPSASAALHHPRPDKFSQEQLSKKGTWRKDPRSDVPASTRKLQAWFSPKDVLSASWRSGATEEDFGAARSKAGEHRDGPWRRRAANRTTTNSTLRDELDDEDSSFCWTANVTQGGIYTASTVARSTRAWDMRFAQLSDIAGPLGDLEHVRTLLGAGTELDANTLYWLTDATPHESMVLEESTYRQYFRLVTSEVSIWYSAHSSENPKGVRPDPKVTQVVAHDKFLDLARQARLLEESDLRKDEVWDLHAKERGLGTEGEEIDALLDRLKLDIR